MWTYGLYVPVSCAPWYARRNGLSVWHHVHLCGVMLRAVFFCIFDCASVCHGTNGPKSIREWHATKRQKKCQKTSLSGSYTWERSPSPKHRNSRSCCDGVMSANRYAKWYVIWHNERIVRIFYKRNSGQATITIMQATMIVPPQWNISRNWPTTDAHCIVSTTQAPKWICTMGVTERHPQVKAPRFPIMFFFLQLAPNEACNARLSVSSGNTASYASSVDLSSLLRVLQNTNEHNSSCLLCITRLALASGLHNNDLWEVITAFHCFHLCRKIQIPQIHWMTLPPIQPYLVVVQSEPTVICQHRTQPLVLLIQKTLM